MEDTARSYPHVVIIDGRGSVMTEGAFAAAEFSRLLSQTPSVLTIDALDAPPVPLLQLQLEAERLTAPHAPRNRAERRAAKRGKR